MAAFDYRDYHDFDDSAFVRVRDSLNNLIATPWYEHGLARPNYWDGPWTYWSWTAAVAGNYQLEYGVANLGDNSLPSAALFDTPIPNLLPCCCSAPACSPGRLWQEKIEEAGIKDIFLL